MKKLSLFFALILVSFCAKAQSPYDFIGISNGDTILYKIISHVSPYTAAVVNKSYAYDSLTHYSGAITIPSTVTDNTIIYTVTKIEDGAFSSSLITSISLPNTIDSIGNGAFSSCSITSINLPNSVTFIGGYAFEFCLGLTSFVIPNSVTSIRAHTFMDSYNLISVSIPNSITTIGDYAFADCSALTSLSIPSSVTSIGMAGFRNCNYLTSITCQGATPPTINQNTFENITTTTPVIALPCNSSLLYQAAQYWSNFTNIQGPLNATTNIIDSVVQGNTYNQYGFNETTAGTYTQNLQTINGCDSIVTLTLSVYTLTTPASFVMQNNQHYIELSWEGNGNRYEIMRNNVFLASVTESTYQDNDVISGNTYCYQIRAYADNISSELSQETCQTFVSLNNIENAQTHANLYPNPTSDKTTLELEGLKNNANVIVYDIMGKAIKTYKLNANQKSLEIELNSFASGIYNVKVINSDCNITKKLIVK